MATGSIKLTIVLLIVIGSVSCLPLDINIGACPAKRIPCQCGMDGYTIHIEIAQCSRFHRWKLKCVDCKVEPSNQERCSVYRNCLDCDVTENRCVRCPTNRYGRWCTGVCPSCRNGGFCDRDTGICICEDDFYGNECEFSMGCHPPPLIREGTFDQQDFYRVGSSITYRCNEGHIAQGSTTVICLDTGQWNRHPPVCKLACPPLANPINGFVQHDVRSQTLTYSCKSGYELVGDVLRTCEPNNTWTGNQPECVKIITCDFPTNFANENVKVLSEQRTSVFPGSQIEYSCLDENYVVLGAEIATCEADGTWSSDPPNCVSRNVTCSHPGKLLNGKIIVNGQSSKTFFLRGTTIIFQCNSLHYLFGDKQITCEENNTWSGSVPICVKVTTCPTLATLKSGKMIINKPDPFATSTLFRIAQPIPKFRSNYSTNVTSRIANYPRFNNPLSNLKPEARLAALQLALPAGHFHVGTRASFACESRYYNLVGSKIRSCQPNGEWSGRSTACIPECGRSSAPRAPLVTFGSVSKLGQWPWQVGLSRRLEDGDPLGEWFLICGGSLISESWLITAAHCVTYASTNIIIPADELELHFGKFYRNNTLDDAMVQVRRVSEIHIHPDFEPTTFESDIALIRVKDDVKLTSRVQPVCLPRKDDSDERIMEGKLGTVIGWGMKEDGTYSEVLQYAEVPIVRGEKCQQDYEKIKVPIVVSANMICAGNETGGTDSCSGDSGGPLVFPSSSQKDRWILEGIVSWGSPFGCGNERQYGGYARVRRFVEWIEQFI